MIRPVLIASSILLVALPFLLHPSHAHASPLAHRLDIHVYDFHGDRGSLGDISLTPQKGGSR